MTERYENHEILKKNKLCPFKLGLVHGNAEAISNWHRNIEVILVVGGVGKARYGTKDLSLKEGDIVAVNAEVLHRFYTEEDFSYFYLIVDEGFCMENGIFTDRLSLDPIFRDEESSSLYRAMIEAFSPEAERAPLGAAKRRAAVLALLLSLYERHATAAVGDSATSKVAEEYVKRVLRHMNDRYNEKMTLESLASVCGITKFHLAREFKRYTGQTVLSYLNTLRCERAALLIAEGKSVTEAALSTGFESLSYFSRTYKRIFGTSPKNAK